MTTDSIMASSNAGGVRVWDLPVRLFHWLLVITILVAFLSAEEESPLTPWHQPAGWVAATLIAFRIVWGFVGGEHARFVAFLRPGRIVHHLAGLFAGRPERSIGHNALGGLAILALLGLIGGVIYTGATLRGDSGEELHEALANLLLVLIALHVLAVIAMSLLTRDNLVRAFITGKKRADLYPGVPDARPAGVLAVPVAAIAIGAAAYGATVIDHGAFTPSAHSTVSDRADGEHEED